MCKKLIFVLALVAMVMPVLAIDRGNYSETSPAVADQIFLKVDIDAQGQSNPNETDADWAAWEMSGYYGPLGTQLKNFGNDCIVQMRGITKTGGPGNLGGSRDRVDAVGVTNPNDMDKMLSDLVYVAHTAAGMGKDYIELSFRLGDKRAGWNIDITLWSWDPAFKGSGLAGFNGAGEQADSKRAAWSTTNPSTYAGNPDPNGYGYPTPPYVEGVTESNMPAGLQALSEITIEQGTAPWLSAFDDAYAMLYASTVNVTLDENGRVTLYGWADMLSQTGSQHVALNGFMLSIPEPATIALLGLGGLALIRRKR